MAPPAVQTIMVFAVTSLLLLLVMVCRLDVEPRRDPLGDESNDSSVADPETEGH